MKGFLLFIFLAALVVCQQPVTLEKKQKERAQRIKTKFKLKVYLYVY